jgi:hypothetical protein
MISIFTLGYLAFSIVSVSLRSNFNTMPYGLDSIMVARKLAKLVFLLA